MFAAPGRGDSLDGLVLQMAGLVALQFIPIYFQSFVCWWENSVMCCI